jgi:hypothetical protein
MVNQHMANPSLEHLDCGQAHFSILTRHFAIKLRFKGLPPQDLVRYCDADLPVTLKIRDPP